MVTCIYDFLLQCLAETDGMIHQEDPYIHQCDEDIDFQFSSSYAQCHWTIPEALQPFITHVKWTLEEELFDGEFGQFDNTTVCCNVLIKSSCVSLF